MKKILLALFIAAIFTVAGCTRNAKKDSPEATKTECCEKDKAEKKECCDETVKEGCEKAKEGCCKDKDAEGKECCKKDAEGKECKKECEGDKKPCEKAE